MKNGNELIALEHIDAGIIDEADTYQKKKPLRMPMTAAAAVLVVLCASAAIGALVFKSGQAVPGSEKTGSEHVEHTEAVDPAAENEIGSVQLLSAACSDSEMDACFAVSPVAETIGESLAKEDGGYYWNVDYSGTENPNATVRLTNLSYNAQTQTSLVRVTLTGDAIADDAKTVNISLSVCSDEGSTSYGATDVPITNFNVTGNGKIVGFRASYLPGINAESVLLKDQLKESGVDVSSFPDYEDVFTKYQSTNGDTVSYSIVAYNSADLHHSTVNLNGEITIVKRENIGAYEAIFYTHSYSSSATGNETSVYASLPPTNNVFLFDRAHECLFQIRTNTDIEMAELEKIAAGIETVETDIPAALFAGGSEGSVIDYWNDVPEMVWAGNEWVSVGPTAIPISEEKREEIIAITPETYAILKNIDWDSGDNAAATNRNIAYLLEALREMPLSERPHPTYAEMRVSELCSNFSSYAGDKLYWADVAISDIKKYEAGSAAANTLNGGNAYAVVCAKTNHGENLQLYVMSENLLDNFYSIGWQTSIQGWLVGHQGDTIILCIDRLAGG